MSNAERALDVVRRGRSARPPVVARTSPAAGCPGNAGSYHPVAGLRHLLARAGEPD